MSARARVRSSVGVSVLFSTRANSVFRSRGRDEVRVKF